CEEIRPSPASREASARRAGFRAPRPPRKPPGERLRGLARPRQRGARAPRRREEAPPGKAPHASSRESGAREAGADRASVLKASGIRAPLVKTHPEVRERFVDTKGAVEVVQRPRPIGATRTAASDPPGDLHAEVDVEREHR